MSFVAKTLHTFVLNPVLASPSERPTWLPAVQELWWRGRVVKCFRHDAHNQTAILDAFQKAGWPDRIDDPLPRVGARKWKARRRETVRCLNRGLTPGTIRFRSDGVGGVRWEVVV